MTEIAGLPYTVLSNLSVDNLRIDGTLIVPGNLAPGAPDFAVQFNDGVAGFAGSADFIWDDILNELDVNGDVIADNFNGVPLTSAGSASNFLNEDGAYSTLPTQVAGADTQLQFNNSGAFGASASLTWDGTTLNATQFNGVAITTAGSATDYLNANGTYTAIASQVSGANTQIQFNNAGDFGASGSLTWDGTTLNATQFNGVAITAAGAATDYLDGSGNYSAPNIGVNSVTGDGVGGTAADIVMTFPTASNLGLGNVDNTSDANKPVSIAQQTALDLKLNLAGGAMIGPVTSSSTWQGISFNGVALTAAGLVSEVLRGDGTYGSVSAPVIGSDTEISFNNAGVQDGASNLTWNETNKALTIRSINDGGADILKLINLSGTNVGNIDSLGEMSVGAGFRFGNLPAGGIFRGKGTDDVGAQVLRVENNSSLDVFHVNTLGEVIAIGGIDALDFNGVALTTAGTALDFLDATGTYVAGLDKATYDPTNVNADAFDKANEIGVEQITGTIVFAPSFNVQQNNYNPAGFTTSNMVVVETQGSDENISGLQAPPVGVNRIVHIYNNSDIGGNDDRIIFLANNGASLAANRIITREDNNRTIRAGEIGSFWYDHTVSRWRQYIRVG